MATRRTDELTAVNVEYAITLDDTRGSVAALTFAVPALRKVVLSRC